MNKILRLLFIVALVPLSACSLNPVRLFQSKVPPPITKPPAQQESERRAADLIARKIEKPEELKPVAAALSQSLGPPEKPIPAETSASLTKAAATATNDLNAQLLAMQKQIAELNKLLAKNQGKEIEGTGISLLGPGIWTIIIILGVLAVVCPPALTLMIFAFKRMKAAAGIVVNEMEAAAKEPETKEAVEAIKEKIQSAMQAHPAQTTALKDVITNLKTA